MSSKRDTLGWNFGLFEVTEILDAILSYEVDNLPELYN